MSAVAHIPDAATPAPGAAPGTRVEPAGAGGAIRTVMIGVGKISEEHLRVLSGRPGVTVAGVCDLSPALARYASERFRAGRPFTDYRAMLDELRPDVAHVLTPPHTHAAIVPDCLRAGAHVVVEKPAAPTGAELRSLIGLAHERGRRLVENHNYRFNHPIRRIESLVRDGRIGRVVDVDVRLALSIRSPGGRYADRALPHPSHRLPGGVIHEFITHMAYLLLRFLPDWESVKAIWANHGDDGLFKYDDLDALVVAGPAHGRIRFSCRQGPDCFELTVRGSEGWVRTDLFQPFVQVNRPRAGKLLSPVLNHVAGGIALVAAGVGGFWSKVMGRTPYEGLGAFLDATYEALRTGEQPPVTESDMLATAGLVDAMVAQGGRR